LLRCSGEASEGAIPELIAYALTTAPEPTAEPIKTSAAAELPDRSAVAPVDQSAAANTALNAKSLSLTGLARVLPFWLTIVIASPEVSDRLPLVLKALISSK
jgi:hypothetical protein